MKKVKEEIKVPDKQKEKKKSFWGRFFSKKKLQKPQMVAVLFLRNNNQAEPKILETKQGFFQIAEKTYHTRKDCLYTVVFEKERYPLAIIDEDGLIPRGNADFCRKLDELKNLEEKVAEFQNLALKAIRNAEVVRYSGKEGRSINPKVAIGLVFALIIGFAIFKSYA